MKKTILTLLILFITCPVTLAIEDVGVIKDKMYLIDCITLGVYNNPDIRHSLLRYKMAKSDVGLAKSEYFPNLSANFGLLQKYNSNDLYDSGVNHRYLPEFSVYLDQLLWDFGKTGAYIKKEKFYLIAAEYDFYDFIYEVVNNIKVKYLDVLNAKAILEVAKNNVEINERCVQITKQFYEQNIKSKLDYINAEVCLSEAKVKLVEAENFYKQAFTDLCNAMYVPVTKEFTVGKIDTFDYYDAFFNPDFLETPIGQWHNKTKRPRENEIGKVQILTQSFEELVDVGYKNSPNIKALNSTIEAMEQSLLYTKRKYYPKVSFRTGYKYDNRYRSHDSKAPYLSNHLVEIGLNISSSVNVLKTKYEIQKASLILDDTKNNLDILKSKIYYEVQRCYLDVKTQEQQISNAENKLKKAQENLDYTLNEYIKENANYLELQTARQEYNNSKIDYVRQIYKYNLSLAKLENTLHSNINSINKYADKLLENKKK